ncbi:MAG: phospholipid carrier-dependent glycosyltransferase [Chloroflexota bacterium]|nr:MAG: phospholipid carrier-dependent glycosyltransferase [Chloroflexota bacterium]
MTGPVSGEPVRGGIATRTGARDDVGGILILLALALTFRVIIAYLLPGSGFANDIGAFQFWANNLFREGLYGFYQRDFLHDYTPGYLYVLWAVGAVGSLFGGIGDLIKVPPMLADLVLAYLVWSMALELGAGRWAARLGALIVALNPITWLDSVIWGQVDSVGLIFLLLGLRELWRDRPERAAILTVVGAMIKPQLGILVPIVAAVTIRRALWPTGGYGAEDPPERRRTTTGWEAGTRGPIRIVTTGLAGLLPAIVLSLPFGLALPWGLVEQIFKTAGGYPYVSVNAWNPWALVSLDGSGIAANHLWACDMVDTGLTTLERCPTAVTFGPIPAVVVGTVLTIALFIAVSVVVARRPDRRTILVGLAVLALAFFVVPTRVHERYLFPLVALGAILAAVSRRWLIAYLASSVATFANMYYVLTTLYPNNPRIDDWLGIGPALGEWAPIAVAALTQAAVLVFAITELRATASERLAVEIAATDLDEGEPWSEDGAPDLDAEPALRERWYRRPAPAVEGAVTLETGVGRPGAAIGATSTALTLTAPALGHGAVMPAWDSRPSTGEVGFFGWLRARLFERPIRPDRSAGLEREGGGRLDRLDLWMILVLAAVLLTGRIWRLGEPSQMHFDEVYHPRTATEFLQFWRYGISHHIYEWTHPHLAKYGMALGIIAWGDDRTGATSELGVDVLSADVEPRWDDARSVDRIAGDRLWVATGSEVRAYDLATRRLEAAVSIPGAVAVAVDRVKHRVVVGTSDGAIRLIDTPGLDLARWGGGSPGAAARAFVTVDGPIERLLVSSDGTSIVAVLAPTAAPGEDDAAPGQALAADVVVIDAAGATETGRVRLAGITQLTNAGAGTVALAVESGVEFVDLTSATVSASVELDAPALGIAFATHLDKDRVYASLLTAEGPRVATVTVPTAAGGAVLETTFRLPGTSAGWVGYDLATQMVHVLGSTPAGDAATVYVIEPHANAVYADAALPFEPGAIVLDENERYPSSDRQQLLAFESDGSAATVTTGQHAFAWRLPGVFAGVLMALLLYVLARVLFRRREVAMFLGALVALDGMLFAQSRIGMNDAYVGLGIIAAYTIFAALWRSPSGSRRQWLAFAVGMPIIGGFLGFALAAKWVAAYAIGALGILILTRSALGRVLLILGLLVGTTVLGYLAISVPEGESGGNYLFLVIMVGLTLVAVVANVLHPIAWTWEEQRLAVFGPAVAGAATFLGALALGRADLRMVLGPIAVTPLEAAFALVILSGVVYTAFSVIGRWGFGPMAGPLPDDDPATLLEPAAPAPRGWLRLGAGFGLPAAWIVACLIVLPVALYVVSYIPWALMEQHQLFTGWPANHDDQTLIELTGSMYAYHNNLSSAHAASSPWWAWVFDFKPVWFYQESFAGGTSAAIYDAGNLVAWWLAVPAMAFAAWQAFVRRSAPLALVTIAFACQWIAWARIDRAAFQYHYYTSLPFVFLALAYFLAELWRGASRRTWLLARLAAGAAVLAPTTLWLFHRPLCGFVRVLDVNAGSQACPTLIPDFVLTGRALAIAVVVGIGVLLLVRLLLSLAAESEDSVPAESGRGLAGRLLTAVLTAVGVSLAFIVASVFFADTPLITAAKIPVEPIALVVTIALLPIAAFVATARDARRFVVGTMAAIAAWFVLWYPNIAGLPLPSALSNAYQGFIPTYVFPFQFPVSTVDRNVAPPALLAPGPALLLVTLAGVCLTVGYAAWVWRVTLAEQAYLRTEAPGPELPGSDARS